MAFNIGGTGNAGGGLFPKDEHVGDLLAVIDPEARDGISTVNGTADAIAFRYLVCVEHDSVWNDSLLFGTLLYREIIAEADAGKNVVVFRLAKGTATPGRNAPWLPESPSEEDLALALKWLEDHAEIMPSGRIEILKRKPDTDGDGGSF